MHGYLCFSLAVIAIGDDPQGSPILTFLKLFRGWLAEDMLTRSRKRRELVLRNIGVKVIEVVIRAVVWLRSEIRSSVKSRCRWENEHVALAVPGEDGDDRVSRPSVGF